VALSPNMRGAMFMAFSQAAFTTNDALVKLVSQHLGVGQIMFIRGVFATALMAVLVWRLRQWPPLASLKHPAVLARIIGELGGTTFFLIALANLPIANVSAVFQALPLVITVAAALFLGEYVGPRRWTAILVGFIGVLIIVRPGFDGFNSYSLYVLACVVCCAFRDLATRRIPADIPTGFVSLLTAASVALFGIVIAPATGGWAQLTVERLLLLATAAVFVLAGYQAIIQSMRVGDLSFVAPFRYVSLIWAIAAGYLVFGTVPDAMMLLGATIVILSGLYMLYRERIVGKTKPAAEGIAAPTAGDRA
jgi:drug/metabolite transporter (DMT)-like permease